LKALVQVSYSHSIATMAVSLAVSTQYTDVTEIHPANQRLNNGIDRAYDRIAYGKN